MICLLIGMWHQSPHISVHCLYFNLNSFQNGVHKKRICVRIQENSGQ